MSQIVHLVDGGGQLHKVSVLGPRLEYRRDDKPGSVGKSRVMLWGLWWARAAACVERH